jgi:hypothetical protein
VVGTLFVISLMIALRNNTAINGPRGSLQAHPFRTAITALPTFPVNDFGLEALVSLYNPEALSPM